MNEVYVLRRNRTGDIVGREPLEEAKLFPLLDEHGKQSKPPYPAWEYRECPCSRMLYTLNDIEVGDSE